MRKTAVVRIPNGVSHLGGQSRPHRILLYGDSNTAGFCCGGARFEPYGKSLSRALIASGAPCDIVLCGLNGLTGDDLAKNLENPMLKDVVNNFGKGLRRLLDEEGHQDLVCIMVGTNDLGKGFSPAFTLNATQVLHDVCHQRGIPTVALGPPCILQGPSRAGREQYVQILARWAQSCNNVAAFFDAERLVPRSASSGFWERDELHFSPSGSREFGCRLAPGLLSLLARPELQPIQQPPAPVAHLRIQQPMQAVMQPIKPEVLPPNVIQHLQAPVVHVPQMPPQLPRVTLKEAPVVTPFIRRETFTAPYVDPLALEALPIHRYQPTLQLPRHDPQSSIETRERVDTDITPPVRVLQDTTPTNFRDRQDTTPTNFRDRQDATPTGVLVGRSEVVPNGLVHSRLEAGSVNMAPAPAPVPDALPAVDERPQADFAPPVDEQQRERQASRDTSPPPAASPTGYLKVGQSVEYLSTSNGGWIACKVIAVDAKGSVQIDMRPGHSLSLSEQGTKLRNPGSSKSSKREVVADIEVLADRPPQPDLLSTTLPGSDGFQVGHHVEYLSSSNGGWVPCQIIAVNPAGAVQVSVKPGHLISKTQQTHKLRAPSHRDRSGTEDVVSENDHRVVTGVLREGMEIEYLSPTFQKWILCHVSSVEASGAARLDVKPGYSMSVAEQANKLRIPMSVDKAAVRSALGSSTLKRSGSF